jgi:hypothetical protein
LYLGLPPPVDDTPEALLARNSEAIAELAAMLPNQRQRNRMDYPMRRRARSCQQHHADAAHLR